MNYLLLLAIGPVAGVLGGMFGIGGGLVIIPGLIFLPERRDSSTPWAPASPRSFRRSDSWVCTSITGLAT
ncbi:MAG: hypothetical protein QM757_13680 [Paludibaculum sp.]